MRLQPPNALATTHIFSCANETVVETIKWFPQNRIAAAKKHERKVVTLITKYRWSDIIMQHEIPRDTEVDGQ